MPFKKIEDSRLNEIVDLLSLKTCQECKTCGESVRLLKNKRQVYCKNRACPMKNKRIAKWGDSLFNKTKLTKMQVLRIIELFMMKFPKNLIAYELSVDRKTIWRVLKNLSRILVPNYYNSMEELGAANQIIEIDESKFGKRKYNKGHKVDGVWILGMVEKTGLKRIKLIQVENRNMPTLTNIITSSVNNDSIIYTDGWKGYNSLKNNFADHKSVNHSLHYKDPATGVHTNTIEGCWAGIKMHVPNRGRTKDKINLYLVRYMLTKNEKEHPFEAVIKYLF